ncbi:MAG: hypothetical protein ABI343_15280 [Burkholderiaceae bacterium]
MPHAVRDLLTSYFRSGDAIRSRSVSDAVLSNVLNVPAPPSRLIADWERDISVQLGLEPGDVTALPLPRARARWPDYKRCVQAAANWTRTLGLAEALVASDVALMACRGARYHHDGEQYGAAVFCNLFLGEDKGLDVHFPSTGHRIPLVRGTVLLFDTCQPHAVIQRGGKGFNMAHFASERDCSQVFLSWEIPVEDANVARALQVAFDVDRRTAQQLEEEQVWLHGVRIGVCPESGLLQATDGLQGSRAM